VRRVLDRLRALASGLAELDLGRGRDLGSVPPLPAVGAWPGGRAPPGARRGGVLPYLKEPSYLYPVIILCSYPNTAGRIPMFYPVKPYPLSRMTFIPIWY